MQLTLEELRSLNMPENVRKDLLLLSELFSSLAKSKDGLTDPDFYTIEDFELWKNSFLEDFEPVDLSDDDEKIDAVRYTVSVIERQSGSRTFRVILNVDNGFGTTLITRIQGQVETMLERMVQGQLNRFIARAVQLGNLTKRRNTSYKFPITLPYNTPRPTTLRGKATEEGSVIEAAINFAFTRRERTSFGAVLYINKRSRNKNSNGTWTTGWGDVNSYHYDGYLNIYLNDRAFPHFTDNRWSSTIAHEILHNLGWGHGSGNYANTNAMQIYQECIRTAQGLSAADEKEPAFID